MSEFDVKARDWDNNPMHWERSEAIAKCLLEMIPVNPRMKALEFGAGTGILSFLLADSFSEITLMDVSREMVKVMQEKVLAGKIRNLKPLLFDLEQFDYQAGKFDCIFSLMVLHHIPDTENILNKFKGLLNPGGFLAVADLYTEDGSFHGIGEKVHKGFDPLKLGENLLSKGFKNILHNSCFEIKRESGEVFPVFLLVAKL